MPPIRRSLLPAVLLFAAAGAVVLISLPGLGGPLVLDSVKLHALEPLVARHGNTAVFHTPGFGGELSRIVSMVSFVLNIQIEGRLSPFGLKLTNIAIHLLNGGLVFLLTRLLLRVTPYRQDAMTIALGVSALWLLSPANFNVAMYAVQRMTQLATLFTLAGLVFYTAGRLQNRMVLRGIHLVLAAMVCLPLAALSKPNGVLLLPLALLVEVYFLHPDRPWVTGRQLALITTAGAAVAAVSVMYLYPGLLNYQHRDFTLLERLLTEPRALMSYLRHLVAPYGADTGVFTDDFEPSTSLTTPFTTLLAATALAGAVVFCIIGNRGRLKPIAFGVAFFLVGQAVESTVIPLELYFVHRNYLPSYGIYLVLACTLVLGLGGRTWGAKWLVIILGLYCTYFAAISYARSLTWSSRESIISAAAHYHPRSSRAMSNYAQLALDQGRLGLAAAAADRAIALSDTLPARLERLYIRCRAGDPINIGEYHSLEEIKEFGVSNEIGQALENLLALYRGDGCDRLRVEPLVQSLDRLAARYERRGGNPWTIEYYADSFLYASGNRQRALARLQDRLEAGHLESGLYRLDLLIEQGDKARAEDTLEQITHRFPESRLRRYERTLDEMKRRLGHE